MSLHREWKDHLAFDPAENNGLWSYRRADDPRIIRHSLASGVILAVLLATGGGVAPRADWGAALFLGLIVAVSIRGLLLARYHLVNGGWRAWRQRAVNEPATDGISVGVGLALALFLVTGGGGIGPAFAPIEALLVGLFAGLLSRALLTFLRWP